MNSPKHQSLAFDAPTGLSRAKRTPSEHEISPSSQPYCGVIAVHIHSHEIVACSANALDLFQYTADTMLGAGLAEVSPDLAEEIANLNITDDQRYHVLDFSLKHGARTLDAVVHRQELCYLIDFLPSSRKSDLEQKKSTRQVSKARSAILRARTINEAALIAADAVCAITQFDCVQIYNVSNENLAELRVQSGGSLRLSETDAPIFADIFDQILGDFPWWSGTMQDAHPIEIEMCDVTAPDLSGSLGRDVSHVHFDAVQNTGHQAVFAYRLHHDHESYGLMIGTNAANKLVPMDDWYLIDEIGATLRLRETRAEQDQITEKIWRLRRIENRFASAMRHNDAIEDVIHVLIPILKGLLGADGFAFQYRSELFLSGKTPPHDFIEELLEWVALQSGEELPFSSAQLHEVWAPAQHHIETACGVFVQPILLTQKCHLVWFRGPRSALRDRAAVTPALNQSGHETASSFSGSNRTEGNQRDAQSTPWQVSERRSAQKVFTEYLEVLAAQFALKEENLSLRHFAARAAHDLKEPLRGISMALNIMEEEGFTEDVVELTHGLAAGSARRLIHLTSDLLDYAVLDAKHLTFVDTDLDKPCHDAIELLRPQIDAQGATVSVSKLPAWPIHNNMITRLFLNLIGNALKYGHPEVPPRIEVSLFELTENALEISVSDNGQGIPDAAAEKIFQPLQRLHRQDEVEGSGLGLNICARTTAAHQGSIRLDRSYNEGARFIVRLGKPSTIP